MVQEVVIVFMQPLIQYKYVQCPVLEPIDILHRNSINYSLFLDDNLFISYRMKTAGLWEFAL